jgi:hypothetical protein
MRNVPAVSAAFAVCLATAPTCLAAPQLILSDPKAPLWEMRPLDRHVYILTLEGDWKTKPQWDAEYSIHIVFPNGVEVDHRPTYERLFRRGEVQCVLIEYQYEKNHFQPADKLTVYVTKRKPGADPDQEVISNRLEVAWPFDRDVVRKPPKTRFSEPDPIDAFHPSGEEPAPPPKPEK